MKVLINTLGIQDSGGITVFYKMLQECLVDKNSYIVICNDNVGINKLVRNYKQYKKFNFILVPAKGFVFRLYYENFVLRKVIQEERIELIYNFSGSAQFFVNTPQLIKIQNLLFYSKKLDDIYLQNRKYILWLKQIYLKRIIFKIMANNSKFFEIQSAHVKEYMSDFIKTKDKKYFIKSDINVEDSEFSYPKNYDFTQKIKFLYIVGPHFKYPHKNFRDFTDAMLELKKQNIDFEINVTLTKEQLNTSDSWNVSLNERTNFLGYISKAEKMETLFCDNTILISTSVIETLGLHVIEAIKKGIIPIVPSEKYSDGVYGNNILTYELFNSKSLLNSILSIINDKMDCEEKIQILQNDLKNSENSKYENIVNIFQKVIDVQK